MARGRLRWYLKTCLSIILWKVLHCQPLYDNDCDHCNHFSQDKKISGLQSALKETEILLQETNTRLEEIIKSREEVTDVYKDLMKLYGARICYNASNVEEICDMHPSLVFTHPDECQLYYNCSLTYTNIPIHFEQHLQECRYPDFFSTQTLQCEKFTEVSCGTRKVLKDKCDYRQQQLSRTCALKYPSCSGKTDGLHQGNSGQNAYINCFQERLISTGTCENDIVWDAYMIPYNGRCTNRFEIPHKDGGFLPSCEGKADGNYRFKHDSSFMGYGDYFAFGRQCDAYYRCNGHNATAFKCPRGTVFESRNRTCKAGNHSIEWGCHVYCQPNFKMSGPFPINWAECPYPEQFSESTRRCENFTKVTCGSRPQEKDFCRYWVQLYLYRNMGNCGGYHFSCAGLPNGINEHPVKRPGPYYVRCLEERLIEDGTCPMDTEWEIQMFPYNGQCTQRYAIPITYHNIGFLPDCSRKLDGNYKYPSAVTRCDVYYRCKGGNATALKFPPNTNFEENSRLCMTNVNCSGQ